MTCIKKNGQPPKDGRYLAFVSHGVDPDYGFLGGYWVSLEYNEGHWNCHRNTDGSLYLEAEMTDEVTHWEYLPDEPEVEECLL